MSQEKIKHTVRDDLKPTREAQLIFDIFNQDALRADAIKASRKILGDTREDEKTNRYDVQAYLLHLEKLEFAIASLRSNRKHETVERLINKLVDSICSEDSGFVISTLSEKAKRNEVSRINHHEKLMAEQEYRSPRYFEVDSFDEQFWQDYLKSSQENQKSRISSWVHYLAEPNLVYPNWFKFYAIRSILSLQNTMVEKQSNENNEHEVNVSYKKRSKDTLDTYPELNREALALTFDEIAESITKLPKYANLRSIDGSKIDISNIKKDESSRKIFETSFSRLYAKNMEEAGYISEAEKANIEGKWITFHGGEDAKKLTASLEGFNTQWCIASIKTAESYLNQGDIIVYFSKIPNDAEARKVPRLCIRYAGKTINEVRGLEKGQDVEPIALPILEQKLSQTPESETHYKSAEYQRLTNTIIEKYKIDQPLSKSELSALWGIGYSQKEQTGFAYNEDVLGDGFENEEANNKKEAIESIKNDRQRRKDLEVIFDDKEDLKELYVNFEEALLDNNTPVFSKLMTDYGNLPHEYIAERLIENDDVDLVFDNIDKFQNIDNIKLGNTLKRLGLISVIYKFRNRFPHISDDYLSYAFYENDYTKFQEIVSSFRNIGPELAHEMINNNDFDSLTSNLNIFTNLGNDIAEKLIDSYSWAIADNLVSFKGLSNKIAVKLIKRDEINKVKNNLKSFVKLHEKILRVLKINSSKYYEEEPWKS